MEQECNHKSLFSINLILNDTEVLKSKNDISPGIYLFKVNDRNTITMCHICSNLIAKFFVNIEQISYIVLEFPLLNLNNFT